MRRNNRGSKLLAALLILVMLLCSFPIVYAEDAAAEISATEQEYTPDTVPEAVTVVPEAAEPEPALIPEKEPAQESEPAEVPEEEPATEPDPAEAAEEEYAAEADPAEIPEETPEGSKAETDAEIKADAEIEEESEEGAGEETSEDTLYEFDDDEVGSISEELLEIFNNPDTYERIEFTGNVDIELKNSEICYDRDVTLVARVTDANMDYRLVWEANDGADWFAVASGEEYTFLLTPDIINREYRVVLYRVY